MPNQLDQSARLEIATGFAQNRRCKVDAFEQIAPALDKQWRYCQHTLAKIRRHLSPLRQNNPGVVCVTVAGSYGRMEAAELSDLDLLVMVEDTIGQSESDANYCIGRVWELLEPLGLIKPEVGGIFMQPMTLATLCDPQARGNLEYPKHVFGQRMQLLLDAQPVFGDQNHVDALHQIINWYTDEAPSHPIWQPAQYAVHDLTRYFRSYNVLHQFDSRFADNDSWWLRQIKMHQSRTASYLGLMLLLTSIEDSNEAGSGRLLSKKLTASLTLTPLERVSSVLFQSNDEPMTEVLSLYNHIQARLVSEECRAQLLTQSNAREETPMIFRQLMEDCGQLRKGLTSAFINYQRNLPASVQSMLIL